MINLWVVTEKRFVKLVNCPYQAMDIALVGNGLIPKDE
jgi:hypothetical protein